MYYYSHSFEFSTFPSPFPCLPPSLPVFFYTSLPLHLPPPPPPLSQHIRLSLPLPLDPSLSPSLSHRLWRNSFHIVHPIPTSIPIHDFCTCIHNVIIIC